MKQINIYTKKMYHGIFSVDMFYKLIINIISIVFIAITLYITTEIFPLANDYLKLLASIFVGFITYSIMLLILNISTINIKNEPVLSCQYNLKNIDLEISSATKSDLELESLILALNDDNKDARWRACEILGKIKDKRGVEPLIQALVDKNVRYKAIESLENIGKLAIESLIQSLKNKNNEIRMGVVEVLGKIGDERAVEPLIQLLKDADSDVRLKAVEALGMIRDERAVEPLAQTFEDDDGFVRKAAILSLGKIGNKRAIENLFRNLKDKDLMIRLSSTKALGMIRDERAVEPLIQTLRDGDVQSDAVEALENIGGPAVDLLILALKNESNEIRMKIVEVLGKIGDERAVEPLIRLSKDADSDVRLKAVEALGMIHDDRVVEPLIQLSKDVDNEVRLKAVEALGMIHDDRVVEPLIHVLKNDINKVRLRAVETLEERGWQPKNGFESVSYLIVKEKFEELANLGMAAVEPLIYYLEHGDGKTRGNVAVALGKIGNRKAVKFLISALNDTDDEVRWMAAEALGDLKDKKAVEPLIRALKDKHSYVRGNATWALGEIRDEKACRHLIETLLSDENLSVRKSASYALDNISGRVLEDVDSELKDRDYKVITQTKK